MKKTIKGTEKKNKMFMSLKTQKTETSVFQG